MTQSATIDATNAGNQTITAGTPFSSGQLVTVNVPPNTANGGVGPLGSQVNYTIYECADPGGTAANLPTSIAQCDADTSQGTNGTTNADGSVQYNSYELYVLPNTEGAGAGGLGESPQQTPICNASNECVIAVVTDPNLFTAAPGGLAFTQPFFIQGTNDSGSNPGDGSAPPLATAPSPTDSTVMASPMSIPADGTNASTVTVTLLSGTVPVIGQTVTLTPSSGSSVISSSSGPSNSSGVVEFGVTDTTAESVTYTAKDTTEPTTIMQTATINFTTPMVVASGSSVSESAAKVPNDGTTASTITVTLGDQGATAVGLAGKTVTLTASGGSSTISPSGTLVSDSHGVASFQVTDTTAEQVIYTATDSSDGITIGTETVQFGTVAVSASKSTVTPQGTSGVCGTTTFCAPTSSPLQITVVLLAPDGVSPVSGKTVSLSPSSGTSASVTPESTVTGANGEAVFTVTDATPETVTFSATDSTDTLPITQTAPVKFAAPAASATTSQVIAPTTSQPADGISSLAVKVQIEDQFGDALPNKVVTLTGTPSTSVIITPTSSGSLTAGTTDSSGDAFYTIRDNVAETVVLSAVDTTDGGLTVTQTGSVTFLPGMTDPNSSTMTVDNAQVALGAPAHITVTLRDHYASGVGNPVPGATVSLTASGGSSIISPANALSDSSGNAVFTVMDSTAEIVTYSATETTDTPNVQIAAQVTVTFGTPPPPPAAVADSSVLSDISSVPADGKTSASILVLLFDASGDPLAGKVVKLNASGGGSVVTPATVTTDKNGQASFAVTDTTPESVTYTADDTTDSETLSDQTVTIEFTNVSSTATTTTTSTTSTTTSSTTTSTSSPTSTTTTSSTNSSTTTTLPVSGSAGSGGSDSSSTNDTSSSSGGTSSGGSTTPLAFTGVPQALPWLLALGILLTIIGSVGRRLRISRQFGEIS